MMLIKIAWRNIWRSKKRSAIIIASIIIGLWAGVFLIAFYNGMIEQRVRTAITQEISHIQIHHTEFNKDYDPKYTIQNRGAIYDSIKNIPDVKSLAARMIFMGMISSASGNSGIKLIGIYPDQEQSVTGLKDKLIQGNYFDSGRTNQMLIGERLIKKLKLNLGSKAILTFQDKEGNLASSAFKIKGVYKTSNSPYDEKYVFVRVHDLDLLAGLPGEIHEIAILLRSNNSLNAIQTSLQRKFPDVLIENWMQISPEIGLTVSVSDQMVFIYLGIILLALAFGIINTMMMSVLERTRELGMLMALGMNKLRVFIMIILETLFLVLVGCPAGIVLGLITTKITHNTGIQFKAYKEVYANFGYNDIIYPELAVKQFITIVFLVLITAIISGIFPARRALKLKPVESIRK
jgi:ABC-type lipoprotein release transport system permease subunit